MAGALGLSLAGPRVYGGVHVDDAMMGDGRRDATAADIRRALALYRRADAILFCSARPPVTDYSSRQCEQPVEIDMRGEMSRQRIERALDQIFVGHVARTGGEASRARPRAAGRRQTSRGHRCRSRGRRRRPRLPASRRQAARTAARDPALRSRPYAFRSRQTARRRWSRRAPVRGAFRRTASSSTSSRPRPSTFAGRPFDAIGIGDRAPEHLIAAAQAENDAAAAQMGGDVDVEAGGAQRRKIGDCRLRAGQHDQIGVAGQRAAGPHADEFDRGLGIERIEIVEIGDVRQDRHGDAYARVFLRRPAVRRAPAHPPPAAAARRQSTAQGRAAASRSVARCAPCRRRTAPASPRNLLTMKPQISAASSGAITALVPTRLAMTPPRSISPISTTGTSAARAKPILAMSLARRLISEALPAPSTSTMSASPRSRA